MGSLGGEDYTITNNPIGQGSFGVVFVGRLVSTGQAVAVKSASSTSKAVEALRSEIELLVRLAEDDGAPNIVKILGWKCSRSGASRTAVSVSLAMEMADCSLYEMMKNHLCGLPVDIMIDLVGDCCSAWKSLRSKNVAHRDIKLQNILVFRGRATREGRRSCYIFKLCDLGGSKTSEDGQDVMATLVGTANCLHPKMAREFAKGANNKWRVDDPYTAVQCDGWSFACTLYYAACGQNAFPIGNDRTIYYQATTTLPTDAIAAELVHGHGGPLHRFRFKSLVDNPQYPAWFTHCLSTLLRSLLHTPSFEAFEEMSKALSSAVEYEFISFSRLHVIRYADISGCAHFNPNYPTLRSAHVLDESPLAILNLISDDDVITLPAHVDGVDGQNDDLSSLRPKSPYLVFPVITKGCLYDLKPKSWKTKINLEIHLSSTDLHTAEKMRTASLSEGFRALEHCQMLEHLQQTAQHILDVQSTATLRATESLMDSTSVTLRYANYAESSCQAWILSSEKDRDTAVEGLKHARSMTTEIGKHLASLSKVADSLKECRGQLKEMVQEEWQIPGIEEELSRYNLSNLEELKSTVVYVQQLVQSCIDSRTRLTDRLRISLSSASVPNADVIVHAAYQLLSARSTVQQLLFHVDDVITIIERPFQELKTRVNTTLNQNNVTDRDVRRALAFYNYPRNVARSSMEIRELARQVEAKASLLKRE